MRALIPRQTDLPSVDLPPGLPVDPSDVLPSLPIPSSVVPSESEEPIPSSEPPIPSGDTPTSISAPPSSSEPPISSQASSSLSSSIPSSSVIPPRSSNNNAFSSSSSYTTDTPLSVESPTESLESLTTVATSINGKLTTITTQITALANPNIRSDGTGRTALIAGLTTGLIVILLVVLGAIFAYRGYVRRREREDRDARKKMKETNNLLDSEGFEDDEGFPTMRAHTNSTVLSGGNLSRTMSPAPSLIRSRASESGSIFREDVWPPPQDDLVDPIYKESSQIDLSRIVEDVMGPSAGSSHDRQGTGSTVDSSTPMIAHGRPSTSESSVPSDHSSYADPFDAHSWSHASQNSINPFNAPSPSLRESLDRSFLSPSGPSAALASPSGSSSSIYRPPSPAGPATVPEAYPTMTSLSSSMSTPSSRSLSPTSALANNRLNTQPKKSSPLARALTQDAKIWLSRSPHPRSPPKNG